MRGIATPAALVMMKGILASAVSGAMERNDYVTADALLKRYGDRMTDNDVVRARGVVDKQLNAGIALQAATRVMEDARAGIQPTPIDRIVRITMAAESAVRRFGEDGQILTSPKGAKGEMQVLDYTRLRSTLS